MALIDNARQLAIWESFWDRRASDWSEAITAFDRRLAGVLLEKRHALPSIPVVLEVGCGGSVFLPLAVLGLGGAGIGIDYSWKGCQLAKRWLLHAGVTRAHIIYGDVMTSSPIREHSCDLVYSFGLIEHFDDLRPILHAHARSLKAGGLLVVGAPNLSGLTGFLQRRLDPSVFDWHTVVRREQLIEALLDAGLAEVSVAPFGFFNPNMISWGRETRARVLLRRIVFAVTMLLGGLIGKIPWRIAGPKISSYWIGMGIRRGAARPD